MRRNCHLRILSSLVLAILWALVAHEPLRAHGEVHELIKLTSEKIAANPQDARLRVERSLMFGQDGDFQSALTDLDEAARLEPLNEMVLALRGNILFQMGKPKEAKILQESFLHKHPEHRQVRFDYCKTLQQLGETGKVLAELDLLIGSTDSPTPDAIGMRLEITEAISPNGPELALNWLNALLQKHPLPVFEQTALRLEMMLGKNEEALLRLDQLISISPRPEMLHARKAELLAKMQNQPAAQREWQEALRSISLLPESIRASKSVAALEKRAVDFLKLSPP